MPVQLSLFDLPFPSAAAVAPALVPAPVTVPAAPALPPGLVPVSADAALARILARRAAAAPARRRRSAPPPVVDEVDEVGAGEGADDPVSVLAEAGLDEAVRVLRCGSLAD